MGMEPRRHLEMGLRGLGLNDLLDVNPAYCTSDILGPSLARDRASTPRQSDSNTARDQRSLPMGQRPLQCVPHTQLHIAPAPLRIELHEDLPTFCHHPTCEPETHTHLTHTGAWNLALARLRLHHDQQVGVTQLIV